MADETDDEPELPPDETVPPIDFTTFVLSLSTSALASLGDPAVAKTGSKGKTELALARQTIDLLVLLEEKTQGNLTGEEERLLAQILTDLKLRYVAKAKG